MKKLLFIIALAFTGMVNAQNCPPGQLNQAAKWRFLNRQCYDSSAVFKGIGTEKVAFVDGNGVLSTITFAALLDSLDVPETDSAIFATRRWVDSLIEANSIFVTPQQYGAVADGTTSDAAAFQAAVDAQDTDVFIYVPDGYYLVDENVVVSGKRRVKIWGEGVIILAQDTGASIFVHSGTIGDVEISGLKFSFQEAHAGTSAIKIFGRRGEKALINNCVFYNYTSPDQFGIIINRVPIAERYYGLTTVSNCLFYNAVPTSAVYNFDSTKNGRGIMVTGLTTGINGSEYGSIIGCSFTQIGTAVYFEEGSGNWRIVDNNFTFCNGNFGNDRWTKGIVHVKPGNGNKGKINITGNKFNHNYGIAIYSGYNDQSQRPILVTNNEFLSNSAMPIHLKNIGHVITENIFDRMAETPGGTTGTNPWTTDTARSYILLDSTSFVRISSNYFIYIGNFNVRYAAKTTNSNNTYFLDNIFPQGGLALNIPDAISYIDTTSANTRYVNNNMSFFAPSVTGSATTSGISLNQTWNTSGNPSAIFANITNTGSGSQALLLDLRVGGTTLFRVNKTGGFVTQSTSFINNGNLNFTNAQSIFFSGQSNWQYTGSTASTGDHSLGFFLIKNNNGSLTGTSGIQSEVGIGTTFSPTSGTAVYNTLNLFPTINQTGGANGITRVIYINPTVTSAVNFRAFEIADGDGRNFVVPKTVTTAGTTGAVTINKISGSVNFAAAATSLVVTNSLVDANSIIVCTIASNDATMTSVQVVAANGSFTIYANVAPTAETRVNFWIVN